MSMLYLTGQYANALSRATVTTNPAALAAYPLANLSSGDPSTPTVFGSIAANSYVQAILDVFSNGNFELALTTGWTDASTPGGTATRVSTAGSVNSGTYGVELVAVDVTHPGALYQDITVSAGEYRQVGCFAKTIAGTPSFVFQIQNRNTGKYWDGSAWVQSSNVTPTGTLSGSFSFLYANYRVEDFDACGSDTVTLRIAFINRSAAASTVAIDDAQDVPGINFCAVIGHNLGSVVTPVVQYDPTGAFGGAETAAATMTVARGAFYSSFTMAYTSPWRFVLGGTNWDEPYIGELVLGQAVTCATDAKAGPRKTIDLPSIANMSPTGRLGAYPLASDSRRSVGLTFQAKTATAAREIAAIYERSQAGRYPAIIAPIATEADIYYGRLTQPHVEDRPIDKFWESSMDLIGDPLPLIGV